MRRARESQGKSIDEVVEATKIRSRYVQAIEEGNFDILPGKVYARGFIRTYANYLGLDGTALSEQYLEDPTPRTQEVADPVVPRPKNTEKNAGTTPTQNKVMAVRKRKGVVSRPLRRKNSQVAGIVWVAIAFVVLTAVIVAYASFSSPHQGKLAQTPVASDLQQGTSAAVVKSKSTLATTKVKKSKIPAVTFVKLSSGSYFVNYQVKSPQPLQIVAKAVSGTCWFNVIADGKTIVPSLILYPGQQRVWIANSQIKMVVGASSRITLRVNGVVAPLDRQTLGGFTYTFTRKY